MPELRLGMAMPASSYVLARCAACGGESVTTNLAFQLKRASDREKLLLYKMVALA